MFGITAVFRYAAGSRVWSAQPARSMSISTVTSSFIKRRGLTGSPRAWRYYVRNLRSSLLHPIQDLHVATVFCWIRQSIIAQVLAAIFVLRLSPAVDS